jgi:hypothetical protein
MVPMCLLGPLVCAAFFPPAPMPHDLLSSHSGLEESALMSAAHLTDHYVAWLCRSLSKNRAECSDPNEPTRRHSPLFE